MNTFKKVRAIAAFCFVLVLTPSSQAEIGFVPIPPSTQETLSWCWAAVSEMVLSHYRFPNHDSAQSYQCNIVESLGGTCLFGCRNCVEGVATIFHLSAVIRDYQNIADAKIADYKGRRFRVIPKKQRLSPRTIKKEIDSDDPIIAAISPSGMGHLYPDGMGEHVALIVGYDDSTSDFLILVNDPMPFSVIGYDPYLAIGGKRTIPGQYWIDYDTFVRKFIYKDSVVFERK